MEEHALQSIEEIVATRPAKRVAVNNGDADPSPISEPEQAKKKTAAHTRDNSFLAPIVDKRPLTHEVSSKLTLHMAFSVEGSAVTYEAGDACAVIPQNEPSLVDEILHKLNFSGDVLVQLPKAGTVPLQTALLDHLQITRLTRKIVQAYATIGQCLPLLDLLKPEQQSHLDAYTWDRGLIDLLYEFPEVLRDPADLVATLPKLSPRLYSISSSPAAHAGEIHPRLPWSAIARIIANVAACAPPCLPIARNPNPACPFISSRTTSSGFPKILIAQSS